MLQFGFHEPRSQASKTTCKHGSAKGIITSLIEESMRPTSAHSEINSTNDLPQARPQHELGRKAFINDVVALSQVFLNQSQARSIDIQLQAIRKDMCRLFHADRVRTRLLCTYLGLGTEWLSENNLIRAGLGHGDNCGIVRDPVSNQPGGTIRGSIARGKPRTVRFRGHRSPVTARRGLRLGTLSASNR
jgi:hypothetical protein